MRTRYGHDEHLVTGAIEVYIGVAMRESVRCLDSWEMVQHGLLHSELYAMGHRSCCYRGLLGPCHIRTL